jgi:hypothetical protein
MLDRRGKGKVPGENFTEEGYAKDIRLESGVGEIVV